MLDKHLLAGFLQGLTRITAKAIGSAHHLLPTQLTDAVTETGVGLDVEAEAEVGLLALAFYIITEW